MMENKLQGYVSQFNADDEELYSNIPNADALDFLEKNIPLFDCPDENFERTYYFRWWTYRKHIRKTVDGFVITEFLPDVPWAQKHNTITCSAGHHYYEGRWLHNSAFLDDYSTFWLRNGGNPHKGYSFWIADAFFSRHCVTADDAFIIELLPDLIKNYQAWENGVKHGSLNYGPRDNGLYWIADSSEGQELSIGGHGFRPKFNSNMYGDAVAISKIATMAGQTDIADTYAEKAKGIKEKVQSLLWDPEAKFFKTLNEESNTLVDVRECGGYEPWAFNLPDAGYEAGWSELMNPEGFKAPFGPTFAEQRHPEFALSYEGHECQWNGPSWPFATCNVLTSLANLLNNYDQDVIDRQAYFETLETYTKSHSRVREDGKTVPWIDENLNPYTGEWISRTRLKTWENGIWSAKKGGKERGKDYNHSTYNDLIISGLVGLRPRADDTVEVNPLLPTDTWDYFCLENILYHGHVLAIIWDKSGEHYGLGQGLQVTCDGQKIASAPTLTKITGELPN